jgi:hypothetical protein
MEEGLMMTECNLHKDLNSKMVGICVEQASQKERQNSLMNESNFLKAEIFEGNNSIKTRIANTEVGLRDLKDAVFDNRKIVGDKIDGYQESLTEQLNEHKADTDKKLSGLFRIFIMTITASFLILGAILGFLTVEVRNTNAAIMQHVTTTLGK